MRTRTSIGLSSLFTAFIILTAGALSTRESAAQSEPAGGSKRVLTKPGSPGATGKIPKGGADVTSKAANPAAGAKPGDPGKSASGAAEPSGSGGGLVEFIRQYATWILATIGALLLVVLGWAFLGQRGKGAREDAVFADLGPGEKPARAAPAQKYSSTKIQAADVNSRLAKSVKTTEVETDREYALVVDEEALKMPPLPEHSADDRLAGVQGDTGAIERHLRSKDPGSAFDDYERQLQAHSVLSFPREIERALGEELLKAKHLEKAATVLEHIVATQAKPDVHPDVYFNLGYIRLVQNSVPESRRYFKLYVEAEKNPAYVARAKKILERIRTTPASN